MKEDNPTIYKKILPTLKILNEPNKVHGRKIKSESQVNNLVNNLSTLQLVISNECNLSCRYCYAYCGTYKRSIGKMDFEVAVAAIDSMFSLYNDIEVITFFGGEPLLQIDLIEKVCEYLSTNYKERYSTIGMMSNLYELTNKAVHVIKKYKINIATSLDGDEFHNGHRITKEGKNSFTQVANNIHCLQKEAGQPLVIEVTMTNLHNDIEWSASDVTDYLVKEFQVNNFTVNAMMSFDKNMNALEYSQDSEDVPVEEALERFLDKGICSMRINDLISIITGKMCGDRLCNAGNGQLSIFPNGDIFPCHIYALDEKQRFRLGNVVKLDEVYFNRKRKEINLFNSKKAYDKCEECAAYNLCTSCMGMELVNDRSMPHDNSYCDRYRKYFNELIELYVDLLEYPAKMDLLKKRLKEMNVLCKSF